MALKFGIANDVKVRMKQQSDVSMFQHSVIREWRFSSREEALLVENEVKYQFVGFHLDKDWMPDGYTETLPYSLKDEVISFISSLK